MTDNCRGSLFHILLGDAKINQNRLITSCWHNDVFRFDISMHDWGILMMQIDQSIDDRSHKSQHQR